MRHPHSYSSHLLLAIRFSALRNRDCYRVLNRRPLRLVLPRLGAGELHICTGRLLARRYDRQGTLTTRSLPGGTGHARPIAADSRVRIAFRNEDARKPELSVACVFALQLSAWQSWAPACR
jgi:hypothetical protein